MARASRSVHTRAGPFNHRQGGVLVHLDGPDPSRGHFRLDTQLAYPRFRDGHSSTQEKLRADCHILRGPHVDQEMSPCPKSHLTGLSAPQRAAPRMGRPGLQAAVRRPAHRRSAAAGLGIARLRVAPPPTAWHQARPHRTRHIASRLSPRVQFGESYG